MIIDVFFMVKRQLCFKVYLGNFNNPETKDVNRSYYISNYTFAMSICIKFPFISILCIYDVEHSQYLNNCNHFLAKSIDKHGISLTCSIYVMH